MPRQAKPLSKSELDSLRRRAKKDPEFSAMRADGGQKGLVARVRAGRVEFWFRVRTPGGKRVMKFIGHYGSLTLDQVRDTAQEWLGIKSKRQDVVQVLAERDREATTVAEVIDRYLADFERRAKTGAVRGKRSSYAEAERMLLSRVVPKLGRIQARNLTVERVRNLHREMSSTPAAANRMLTALTASLAFGEREGLVPAGHNPCRHVERFRETGSRRPLTLLELERLGTALADAADTGRVFVKGRRHSVHSSVVSAIRFLALTGFRRGELLGSPHAERRGDVDGLRWGDVDLDAGLVTLQDSKTGRQTRVLGQAAVDLLREAKPKDARRDHCVCPGPDSPRRPFRSINAARRLIWQAAELPVERGVDLHSLRHSYASIAAHLRDGRYSGLVSALLGHGHQSKAITRRYITEDPELLRPAADAVAAEIARLIGLGELAEVVPFPAGGER